MKLKLINLSKVQSLKYIKVGSYTVLSIKCVGSTHFMRLPKNIRFFKYKKFGTFNMISAKVSLLNFRHFRQFLKKFLTLFYRICQPIRRMLFFKGLGLKFWWDNTTRQLTLKLGYSHLITLTVLPIIKLSFRKSTLSIESHDRDVVLNFIKHLQRLKKPNLYTGKGIWLKDQKIIKKLVKKT
jgi:hypothetical protein